MLFRSTNKDLEEEISANRFREDLFYRLNVIPFYVPPLRERVEDIAQLADFFLGEFAAAYGRRKKELAPEALQVLEDYSWPGNVRELKNLVERLVIMVPGERIESRHLPPELFRGRTLPTAAGTLQEARERTEREFILSKLEENAWNVTKTATAIGLERSHLHRKMKALGIAPRKTG